VKARFLSITIQNDLKITKSVCLPVQEAFLDQDWREDDTSQTMLAPSTTDTRYRNTYWTRTGGRTTPQRPCWLHQVMLLLKRFVTFVLYFIDENIFLILLVVKAIFLYVFSSGKTHRLNPFAL
jgi:hypothetical protein